MAEYIYCRVSTDGQTTDPQMLALKKRYPHAHVVSEVASGAKSRPILKALQGQLQDGDVLIVAALDRLGRRTSEVLALIEDLDGRGVILKSEREGVDYSTPVGRLVTQILISVAEMERSMISERTKAGLANARAKGRQIGRPREIPSEHVREGIRLVQQDGYSIRKAAAEVGIHFSYLSQKLKEPNIGPPVG